MTYLNGFQRAINIHETHGERIKPGKTRKKRPTTCELFHAIRGQCNYELIGNERLTMSKPVRRPPLPRGALCAVLFSRGEQLYHWSFIYPTSAEDATKFHAVTGAESWLYQKDEHFVARSKHACVVVQLSMLSIEPCDVH